MNIALLDDHELMRLGIRMTLTSNGHNVSIDADTADRLFAELDNDAPCELLILDLLMPDVSGVEVAQRIRNEHPSIHILVYSVDTKVYTIMQLMQIGIDGFVSKNSGVSEILQAVSSIEQGVPYYGKDIAELIHDIVDAAADGNSMKLLSPRELEIVRLSCDGLMGKEIAEKLHISLRTVNAHKTHIFNKLGLRSNVEMVRYAIEHGII